MTEPSYEELKAQLAELKKQNGSRRTGALDFRGGEKGGVSVYGLGRFPVTLYYEQWIRLLDTAKDLREFLEENKANGKLKLKEGSAEAGGRGGRCSLEVLSTERESEMTATRRWRDVVGGLCVACAAAMLMLLAAAASTSAQTPS